MRGLMMGRFQPFHLGHMELVRQVLRECDEVAVAVTSAQYNYIDRDPFTAGERIGMILESLRETRINPRRYMVLGLENQRNVATWASYLRAALPKFDRVYSGNRYVQMLLADSGVQVVRPDFVRRGRLNGTAIRDAMRGGGEWRAAVPAAVARCVDALDGEGRIRAISDSDTDPTKY